MSPLVILTGVDIKIDNGGIKRFNVKSKYYDWVIKQKADFFTKSKIPMEAQIIVNGFLFDVLKFDRL